MSARPDGSLARELRCALALGASAGVTWAAFEDLRIMARRFHVLGTLSPENLALLRPEVLLEAMILYAALFGGVLALVALARAALRLAPRDEPTTLARLVGWLVPFFVLMAWRLVSKLALAGNPYLTKVPAPTPLEWAVLGAVAVAAALAVGALLTRIARRATFQPLFRVRFHVRLALVLLLLFGLPSLYPLLAIERPSDTALGATLQVRRDPTAKAKDWNVLLLVLDTTRADHTSTYGYPRETTPFLTRLAREGVLFENARAVAPWTLPSHASLFTGLYPSSHGARGQELFLHANVPTLAELLRSAGYQTACWTNNPWLGGFSGVTRGFEHFVPVWKELHALRHTVFDLMPLRMIVELRAVAKDDGAAATIAMLRRWLAERDRARPFFAFVNLMEAHQPNFGSPHGDRFLPADLSDQDRVDMQMDSKLFESGKVKLSARQLAIQTDLYDAELAYLDSRLAELWDALRAAGDLERTLVVVTADHGELLGEQGQMGHQFALWEPLLRIPLIIAAADPADVVARGLRSDFPAQTVDLPATLAGLVGVTASGFAHEGLSLASIVLGRGAPEPRVQIAEYQVPDFAIRVFREVYPELDPWSLGGDLTAVVDGPWKLIEHSRSGVRSSVSLHRVDDESRDRAADEPARAANLEQIVTTWREKHGTTRSSPAAGSSRSMTPEERDALKALGYAG